MITINEHETKPSFGEIDLVNLAPVDRDELMGFVQITLRMVNALPA